MNSIENKLVLISGASSGIGAEAAVVLARKDAKVIILARSTEKLKNVAFQISKSGGKVSYFSVDLSIGREVEKIAETIKNEHGIPDIIINNAGYGVWKNMEETSTEEALQMMTVPYLAAFSLTKAFITEMKESGNGQIINITSIASFLPIGNAVSYSVARSALRGFSEALRGFLLGTGITVSLAVFGKVSSSYWHNNPGSEEKLPLEMPFIPSLSTNEVANYIVRIINKKKRFLVRPRIFIFFFCLYRHFPDLIAKRLNKTK